MSKHQQTSEVTALLQWVPQCLHWMRPWIDVQVLSPIIFLVPGNTATSQSMLGTSSPDDGLVNQSTNWSTIWVVYTYPSDFTQYASLLHSIRITKFVVFIPISAKPFSTGIHTVVITSTDLSGSQDYCILPVLLCFVGPPINLTGGIITTGIVLSLPISYFLNRTTVWWSDFSFNIYKFAAKENSVD